MCELAKLIETGLARLDRIDERIVNLDGRLADVRNKQVFADLKLVKIEEQLANLAGRLNGIEDQIRAMRVDGDDNRAARRRPTKLAGRSRR